MKIEFPRRLTLGKMMVGPEWYGCINTGMRAVMYKSKILAQNPRAGRGLLFVCGPQLHCQDAVSALLMGNVPEGQNFVEFNSGRVRVTFCRTYKTAKARFQVLCDEQEKWNTETAARHLGLKERAAQGDMAATINLIDF